jgi:flagellar secretion chaperone FliS
MVLSQTELSYRKSAIEGASPIGLIVVLFDTLVGDLRRAAAAIRESDIGKRCNELNHATLVLGHLESWIDMKQGGESAKTLAGFYAYLRAKMMEAAISQSASLLETQMEMILQVRSAWQKLDTEPPEAPGRSLEIPTGKINTAPTPMVETQVERIPFSQSG